ncbi:hypothetical protein [Coralloluteibacterium thermophilus]|uniref:Uncharacterized protein n=1 Tax=Coralloluteibacterium thermophilum TaxID=2707049 RepID=A0ABV9NP75_9GAMM
MTGKIDPFSRWREIRRQGAWRFVLLWGALAWGLGTAALYCGFMWLVADVDMRRLLPFAVLLFPVGGLAWGGIMWWIAERRYRQHAAAGGA